MLTNEKMTGFNVDQSQESVRIWDSLSIFLSPPHEVRKGDYWIRHRLSVRPSVQNGHGQVPRRQIWWKNTIILSRRGTLELSVHWFNLGLTLINVCQHQQQEHQLFWRETVSDLVATSLVNKVYHPKQMLTENFPNFTRYSICLLWLRQATGEENFRFLQKSRGKFRFGGLSFSYKVLKLLQSPCKIFHTEGKCLNYLGIYD